VSLSLYVGVHVPRAITVGLRLRGVDVLTAQEDGLSRAPDDVLLERPTELGRVLFSQDEDLLAEAARRQREGALSPACFTHTSWASRSAYAFATWR